jgi:AcrR family transcriptional regulator
MNGSGAATSAVAGAGGAGSGAESRQLILDTAARLFRDQGYAAVSLRTLAARCGMKAGSLYYHFASKDEIVAEVLRVGVERVYHEVTREVAALPTDVGPEEVVRVAVRSHLRALLELQDYTSANIRIFGQVPDAVRAAHVSLRDDYEREWAKMLGRFSHHTAADRERLRLARLFLIAAMNGTLEWFHPEQTSVDEIAEQLTRLFLHGLRDGVLKST